VECRLPLEFRRLNNFVRTSKFTIIRRYPYTWGCPRLSHTTGKVVCDLRATTTWMMPSHHGRTGETAVSKSSKLSNTVPSLDFSCGLAGPFIKHVCCGLLRRSAYRL